MLLKPQPQTDLTPDLKPQKVKLESKTRETPLIGTGQVDEIFAYFDNTPACFRYDVKNDPLGSYRHCLSSKTIKRMFKRGHLDNEVWMFINPKALMKKQTRFGFRSEWTTSAQDNNFVLDFDHCHYATTPEGMRDWIVSQGSPEPAMIVQTSPKSFHVAYFFRGELNRGTIQQFAWRLVGSAEGDPLRTSERAFKAHYGLDLNYLRQTNKEHKIRVPGTVNSNFIDRDQKAWVCKAWYAKEVALVNLDFVPEVKKTELPKRATPKKILNTDAQAAYLAFLSGKLSKRLTNQVAKFFAYRSGFLEDGRCAVSQTQMADELKMLQPSVSRLLKRLALLGFLKVTNRNYNYKSSTGKVVCMEYGLGDELAATMNPTRRESMATIVEELAEDYVDGERNAMMLKDVRYLRFLNAPLRERIEFLKKKHDAYSASGRKTRMSEQDIEYMIENFERKAEHLAQLKNSLALSVDVRVALDQIGLNLIGG